MKATGALLLAAMSALIGCADKSRITFVTSTKVAIDGDATNQSLTIGYDRYEGVVGPAYENGAIPPVVAKLDSDLSILNPKVKQFYATGDAAVLATCGDGEDQPDCPSEVTGKPLPVFEKARRLMFFGTGSVIGFKASFAGNAPESVTFGYKRREFSWLPVGPRETADGTPLPPHNYGSVLASLDLDQRVQGLQNSPLRIDQFFATGLAAENIAQTSGIRAEVKQEAAKSARRALTSISQPTFDSEGRFEGDAAKLIDQAIFPGNDGVPDEAAVAQLRQCLPQANLPETMQLSIFLSDRERFGNEQAVVAQCMGLVEGRS